MRITVNILNKKPIQILIIIIGIALIVSLSRSILKMFKAKDELRLAEQKIEELQKEAASLTEKREFYQSEEFIEQEARNKLNMAKEGETVVVLPPNLKEILGEKENQPQTPLPNWRQWLSLFL
jgi:cell division protein FtsB